jgi:hypothetical protein
MTLINFTKENLSRIHISQLKQFLDKNLNHNDDVAEVREWQGLLFIIIKKKTCYFDKLVNNENNKICKVNGKIESINDLSIFELKDLYKISFHFNSFNFCFESKGKFYEKMESLLLNYLEKKYEVGNLTQFHELFTEVYNEIMGYPINEKE